MEQTISMNKIVTYSFTSLPDDIIFHIASFMDDFHTIQFSLSSKGLKELLYDPALIDNIQQYMYSVKYYKYLCFIFIHRINTDGVIYGECEQCFNKQLLYTHNDGENEKCICLDNCTMLCLNCDCVINVHLAENGCPNCRHDLYNHRNLVY